MGDWLCMVPDQQEARWTLLMEVDSSRPVQQVIHHGCAKGNYLWAGRQSSKVLWQSGRAAEGEHRYFRKNWNAKLGMGQENATETSCLSKLEPFQWQ